MADAPKPKKEEKLEELRERLYAREGAPRASEGQRRSKLSEAPKAEVPRSWQSPQKAAARRPTPPAPPVVSKDALEEPMARRASGKNYRLKILIGGIGLFVLMLLASSLFFLFGNNSISGQNIAIDVSGPFTVGGGEEMPLQIAIANQNDVAIESATLVIEYPAGTQSADEPGKELYTVRQPLDDIQPGEVRNVSTNAVMYGEENEEKTINVSVEYRVHGSNATFYKDADPLRFKISSSPVSLNVDAVHSITSGQEADVTLTVQSNSPTPLSDVLVAAKYPDGFDFTSSDPAPVAGRDTWRIDTLNPEEKKTITLHGVVTGEQNDVRHFDFSVGVASNKDQLALASTFTTVSSEMDIEAPFLSVSMDVNGDSGNVAVVKSGQPIYVRVGLQNTQNDTLYDGTIAVQLSGNAVNNVDVSPRGGFYGSKTHTVTFDSVDTKELAQIAPGSSESVAFTIDPKGDLSQTPELDLSVSVKANRVSEDNVKHELSATVSRTIRVEGGNTLSSSVQHAGGPFTNSGPVPPVAEQTTEYTLQFAATGGSNDSTDAEMTAVLPQYISWEDNVSGDGDVSYNSTNRTLTWNIGSMNGGETKRVYVQVGMTPSASQAGQVPTIAERQYFRATDRFTNTVVRTEAAALTTATPGESGDTSGRVQAD